MLLHQDGAYRQIEAVCITLLDNTYIQGLVAKYRDITKQKALEQQKEEFIAVASHELKTPVTSIKGYTQIIQAHFQEASSPEVTILINKLNNQVGRLTNLLDVTKITSGQLALQVSKFDINGLNSEIVEEIGLTTNKKSSHSCNHAHK